MKKILLTCAFFILAACSPGDSWTGYYYPDKDDIEDESQWLIQPGFKTIEDCADWVLDVAENNTNYDYECGYNCTYRQELGVNVCEKTERLEGLVKIEQSEKLEKQEEAKLSQEEESDSAGGESNSTNDVHINGVSLSNTHNLKISADKLDPSDINGPQINITVEPISNYIEYCVASDEQREIGEAYLRDDYYKEMLITLREDGMHPELPEYDSTTCGWTRGNLNHQYMQIDGNNAITYDKGLFQSSGSLSTFYKQVIFVDKYDQVYDIIFSYNFGDLGDYLETIADEYGGAYANPDNWDYTEKVWQEVVDYFESDKPISTEEIKDFEENEKIINEMIKSIKIEE